MLAAGDHPSSYSLNNLSGDEVVVRLAEWCVISLEYFWRVLCAMEFLTLRIFFFFCNSTRRSRVRILRFTLESFVSIRQLP